MTAISTSTVDPLGARVNVGSIIVNPQVRKHFDAEAHAQLTESVRDHGILQPLIVKPGLTEGTWLLIAGERRLRAAVQAQLETVPVRIMANDTPITVQLIENLQREQLTLEETAAAVSALYDQEKSQSKVAKIIGKSVPYVSKLIAVHNKLGPLAAELLALGATEDIELLGLMTRIQELDNSYPRADILAAAIVEKKAGRAEAKELYAELQRELADSPEGTGEGEGEEGEAEGDGLNWTALDGIHNALKGHIAAAITSWNNPDPAQHTGREQLDALIKATVRGYQGHALVFAKEAYSAAMNPTAPAMVTLAVVDSGKK